MRLLVPWEDVEDFLEDERREIAFWQTQPPRVDVLIARAVEHVWFGTSSDMVIFEVRRRDALWALIAKFEEVAHLLPVSGDELLASPGAYVDRHGTLHVGQDTVLRLARALCSTKSHAILSYGEQELAELHEEVLTGWATSPFKKIEPYQVDREAARTRLEEEEAAWNVVREWCGGGAVEDFDELTALRRENERLQGVIEDTARWLKGVGHHVKAAALRRSVKPHS